MSEQLQLRRGTAAQVAAFTGAQGEIVVDATNNRIVVQDGATAGGFAAAKLSEVLASAGGEIALLGIGTAADPDNPLSVFGTSALFSTSGSFNVTVNKAAAGATASFIFEDSFSGRAQIGLTGDDNFHFKVSPNGSTWIDAMDINAATGVVSAAMGFSGSPDPTYLKGLISGLTLSNDATNPNAVLDISAGVANSDDSSCLMKLPAPIVKSIASPWAAGSGVGGLDTGAVAALTWYHVYAIARTDAGAVDALFSVSATAPAMPAGYTKKRRIGSVKTDASGRILAFTQLGQWFYWKASTLDVNGVAASATAASKPVNVPPGVNIMWRGIVAYAAGAAGAELWAYSPIMNDEAASASESLIVTASTNPGVAQADIMTDANQNVRFVNSGTVGAYSARTLAWFDFQGR